jgi:site-specific DNA recombinase
MSGEIDYSKDWTMYYIRIEVRAAMDTRETIAAYVRVSTKSTDQLTSFEGQRAFFEQEYGDKYRVLIYADRGLSGTSLRRREQFEQMLYDAGLRRKYADTDEWEPDPSREPLFRRILVRNTSRFARNVLVVGILRALRANGVYVHFLDKGIDTKDEDWEFVFNLFMNFDQQESIDKSKKVRAGLKMSAQRGQIYTADRLFGYKYYPGENRLEIIPEEAAIVRELFDLYERGEGIRRILNIFREKGYRTREGREFQKSTISRMLGNEKYAGILVRNKYDSGIVFQKHRTHRLRPREEWVIHEGVIPAIIDREQFERVQAIRDGKVHTGLQRGVHKGRSLYAGKIRCGKCGANYRRNVDNGRFYYNCATKKARGLAACDSPNVNEARLNEIVSEVTAELPGIIERNKTSTLERLAVLREELAASIDQDKSALVAELNKQADDLRQKKTRLLDLYLDGSFDKDMLAEKTTEIDRQLTDLTARIAEASRTNDEIMMEIARIDQYIERVRTLKARDYTEEEVREMVRFDVMFNRGEVFVSINALDEVTATRRTLVDALPKYAATIKATRFGVVKSIR